MVRIRFALELAPAGASDLVAQRVPHRRHGGAHRERLRLGDRLHRDPSPYNTVLVLGEAEVASQN